MSGGAPLAIDDGRTAGTGLDPREALLDPGQDWVVEATEEQHLRRVLSILQRVREHEVSLVGAADAVLGLRGHVDLDRGEARRLDELLLDLESAGVDVTGAVCSAGESMDRAGVRHTDGLTPLVDEHLGVQAGHIDPAVIVTTLVIRVPPEPSACRASLRGGDRFGTPRGARPGNGRSRSVLVEGIRGERGGADMGTDTHGDSLAMFVE